MGNNIVITGAGGVLCGTFAKFLAKQGHQVFLLDRNFEAAQKIAEEIGQNAYPYQVDVLDRSALEQVKKQINQQFGSVQILINGAGGNSPKCTTTKEYFTEGDETDETISSFFNLQKEGFDFVFSLNMVGTLLPTQVFAVDMIGKQGCSILNVSSMNAFTPLTKIPAYSAAKSAVSNFTQWLAVHFAKEGIRVNAIAPGFFVTAQNKALLFDEEGNATPRTEKILAATPMGRFGEAEELLGAVDFLLDYQKSAFVTGTVIPIDGGFSAYSGV